MVFEPPAWRALPGDRAFDREFLALRERVFERLASDPQRDHLVRTGDWLLALAPDADEPLVIAALLHDLERSIPGGPMPDMVHTPWDDVEYNRAHCERSVLVVCDWLRHEGASARFVAGVQRPIREHEFGGSPEGDTVQAADSLSFLEGSVAVVVSWVEQGRCGVDKGRAKLRWMYERIRLDDARAIARPLYERALASYDDRFDTDRVWIRPPTGVGRSRRPE